MYNVQNSVNNVQCSSYNEMHSVNTVNHSVYNIHQIVYNVHYSVYNVQWSLYTVQRALHRGAGLSGIDSLLWNSSDRGGLAILEDASVLSNTWMGWLFCHSPTQPQQELELDLIMSRKPPTTHPGTFKALPDNLGSWFSVCNLILTKPDKIWKMTSIFFFKWKTT